MVDDRSVYVLIINHFFVVPSTHGKYQVLSLQPNVSMIFDTTQLLTAIMNGMTGNFGFTRTTRNTRYSDTPTQLASNHVLRITFLQNNYALITLPIFPIEYTTVYYYF